MEVSIFSRESIRPSTLHNLEPVKLNLIDQLTPSSYSPLVLFYRNPGGRSFKDDLACISRQLKWSLSEGLSVYYPLAGRVRDNFAIHDFHEGVPFVEARVRCQMAEFLRLQGSCNDQAQLLNDLLPFRCERMVPVDTGPQMAVQLNVFECGGLAIGLCSNHKSHDGSIGSESVKAWAAINCRRGGQAALRPPNFSEGVLAFPPVRSIPLEYMSRMEGIWFGSKGDPVSRRFVFDLESIAKLRVKAKSRDFENPTRANALSAFIWKSIISATASASQKVNSYEPSLMYQTVDLRRVTRPRLSRQSFGNLILSSGSSYDPKVSGEPRMDDLAVAARNGMSKVISNMKQFSGEAALFDYFDRMVESSNESKNELDVSCWHGFGLSKIDFGWGPSVWVGLSGPGASGKEDLGAKYTSDTAILIENSQGGIEAWLTLDEPGVMKALETDPDFLEYASTISHILP